MCSALSAILLKSIFGSQKSGTNDRNGEKVEVAKCNDEATTITTQDGDVGYDIYADKDAVIGPGQVVKVGTGIKTQLEGDFYPQLFSKSSMAAEGIMTQGGVMDPSYRGEWKVLLFNSTDIETSLLKKGKIVPSCVSQNGQTASGGSRRT